MELMDHQKKAIKQIDNGKILYGGVGSGKSATVLGYYTEKESPKDIVVITTAKKRDSLDWIGEAAKFGIGTEIGATLHGTITVDSWNNIDNYLEIEDAFFIFDEQRLVGNGMWVKSFLKIVKKNRWVLLSATPGDSWIDYIPVFVANGFYRNVSEFKMKHVLYAPYVKYPVIRGYLNAGKLELLRNEVLVEMPYVKHTKRVLNWIDVSYDKDLMDKVVRDRWHPYEDRPIKDVAEVFRLMRKVSYTDPSRLEFVRKLMKSHDKLIIFYNFNYELDILRLLGGSFYNDGSYEVAEWNGHKKQPIPSSDKWLYLVQYVAGAEGWNCIDTDAMILYSLTYSYKNFEQAQGRIDRLDTPFKELFYYAFLSNSAVDRGTKRALEAKESFNELKERPYLLAMCDVDAPF